MMTLVNQVGLRIMMQLDDPVRDELAFRSLRNITRDSHDLAHGAWCLCSSVRSVSPPSGRRPPSLSLPGPGRLVLAALAHPHSTTLNRAHNTHTHLCRPHPRTRTLHSRGTARGAASVRVLVASREKGRRRAGADRRGRASGVVTTSQSWWRLRLRAAGRDRRRQ